MHVFIFILQRATERRDGIVHSSRYNKHFILLLYGLMEARVHIEVYALQQTEIVLKEKSFLFL